jgi:hypothetical protein
VIWKDGNKRMSSLYAAKVEISMWCFKSLASLAKVRQKKVEVHTARKAYLVEFTLVNLG